jgi:hypothetical protein
MGVDEWLELCKKIWRLCEQYLDNCDAATPSARDSEDTGTEDSDDSTDEVCWIKLPKSI